MLSPSFQTNGTTPIIIACPNPMPEASAITAAPARYNIISPAQSIPIRMLFFRPREREHSAVIGINPIRKPPVGPISTPIPPVNPEKTGSPHAPSIR